MTLLDDVHKLQTKCSALDDTVGGLEKQMERLDQQVNGERGISTAINMQTSEIQSLRKAAYWVAGLIVASSIAFAFSVLVFFA